MQRICSILWHFSKIMRSLKVLSSEMDLAEGDINRQVYLKEHHLVHFVAIVLIANRQQRTQLYLVNFIDNIRLSINFNVPMAVGYLLDSSC